MTIDQFTRRAGPASYDSSIWSRFTQPTRLVWVRDTVAADQILMAVRKAVLTAGRWAACLLPGPARPAEIWRHLFSETYRNELRPENAGRVASIIEGRADWFEAILAHSWSQLGFPVRENDEGGRFMELSRVRLLKARRQWRQMRRLGRWLNAARLVKAASLLRMALFIWRIKSSAIAVWPCASHLLRRVTLSSVCPACYGAREASYDVPEFPFS